MLISIKVKGEFLMLKRHALLIAAAALLVAGGLVFWGSSFAKNMVHDNLIEQKVKFGSAASLKAEGDDWAVKYADQDVDTALEAKAYSDYIKGHLKKVAGGKTYSEVSAAFQKDKTNQTLSGQRQTLFMGETLRGLLLNAYGWGLLGMIAFWASIVLFAGAVVALLAYLHSAGLLAVGSVKKKSAKKAAKRRK